MVSADTRAIAMDIPILSPVFNGFLFFLKRSSTLTVREAVKPATRAMANALRIKAFHKVVEEKLWTSGIYFI